MTFFKRYIMARKIAEMITEASRKRRIMPVSSWQRRGWRKK